MDIDQLLEEYFSIRGSYTIDNGVVNVDGRVTLIKDCEKLPVKFGSVSGYFECCNNHLTTLLGCPSSVGSGFDCTNNQLINLEGCPSHVGGGFHCSHNRLTSLQGCPKSVDEFDCSYNYLTTLEGCPSSADGSFYCYNNQLVNLEYLPDIPGMLKVDKHIENTPEYKKWQAKKLSRRST